MNFEAENGGNKQFAFDLNIEAVDPDNIPDNNPDNSDLCTICLEPVLSNNGVRRATVTLSCDHKFHLDCIGTAFNAKGIMQCPNCMQVEDGEWQFPNGIVIPELSDDDDLIVEDQYEPLSRSFTDVVLGMELCPFHGFPSEATTILGQDIFAPGFEEGRHCLYVEGYFNATIVDSSVPRSIGESSNTYHSRQITTSAWDQSPTVNQSYVARLLPYGPFPPNPRVFWTNSEPGVMRARHYIAHPFFDHSTSFSSMVNAQQRIPTLSGDLSAPVVDDHVFPNGPQPFAASTVTDQVNQNGFNNGSVWEPFNPVERNEIERELYRIIYGNGYGINQRYVRNGRDGGSSSFSFGGTSGAGNSDNGTSGDDVSDSDGDGDGDGGDVDVDVGGGDGDGDGVGGGN